MIDFELNESEGVVVFYPEQEHGLSEADFEQLTTAIDGYLKDHEFLNGLIIVTKTFPGWENLKAFSSHLKFVHEHHKKIQKVAVVSDSALLSAAPHLAHYFVSAKIRHFDSAELAQAKKWVATAEQSRGHFVILDDYPGDVVALRAEGTIERRDYEELLIPEIEKQIEKNGKVKLLMWFGEEFEGYSAGAMWEDTWFGTKHLADFKRIAVVSDVSWIRHSVKLFAPLIPAQTQLFANADIESAKEWISEN